MIYLSFLLLKLISRFALKKVDKLIENLYPVLALLTCTILTAAFDVGKQQQQFAEVIRTSSTWSPEGGVGLLLRAKVFLLLAFCLQGPCTPCWRIQN
jgi:hypothetical protein